MDGSNKHTLFRSGVKPKAELSLLAALSWDATFLSHITSIAFLNTNCHLVKTEPIVSQH